MYPETYKYTNDHEWVGVEGDKGRVGITDYAQKQLGDIVYLDLPEVGKSFKKGDVLGSVESVKAVSEIFAPVSGVVVEVNGALGEHPEAVNKDAHGSWLVVLKLSNPAEVGELLDAARVHRAGQVTHRYIPNTDQDVRSMLDAIGVGSVDDLFAPVPERVRLKGDLKLPPAMGEPDLMVHLEELAARNTDPSKSAVFLGAGAYRHVAPSFIDQMLLRSEFYTAYTPYQPEISQGTLQSIFEFQTMAAEVLGTDIANASMYDGSTAMVESALLAARLTGRKKVVVAATVHPHYRGVLRTYTANLGFEVVEAGYTPAGTLDLDQLAGVIPGAAAVIFQYPNFFGVIEDPRVIVAAARAAGAMTVAVVNEPVALGLLVPPGKLGVDLVAAELQSFGIPVSFGGPYCGVIGATEKCLRQMPGRLVGMAKDTEGRIGYVLTLSTREQHIRREKATSNICTNSGLMSLAANMFMAAFGKHGLNELARLNFDKAHHARTAILDAAKRRGIEARFSGPFFNEFVVGGLGDASRVQERLQAEGVVAGLPLGTDYPELADSLLVCVTEVNRLAEIDKLASTLAGVANG